MRVETAKQYADHVLYEKECDYTKDGKCSQCGECCGRLLPLTEKERVRIHRYIKAHNIKECVEIVPLAKPAYDMTCPFLDKHKPDKKCRIYEVRPGICRAYCCNKPEFDYKADGWLMDEPHKTIDMRTEFFGR